MPHNSDMTTLTQETGLRSRLLGRIAANPDEVWVPGDFADLANRPAIDKTLQRLVASGDLRRIDRGLYDRPRMNDLTGRPTVPDYRAVTCRNQARTFIDGMTAANELGLTTAAPARIEVLVDARLRPIKLGNQEIHFRYAAPSHLNWAGRPCASSRHCTGCKTLSPRTANVSASRPNCAPCSPIPGTGNPSGTICRQFRGPADLDAGVPAQAARPCRPGRASAMTTVPPGASP